MGCNASTMGGCNSSTTSESSPKGTFDTPVEWEYFGLEGRGSPLKQLFEYHGQANNKKSWDPEAWEAAKA